MTQALEISDASVPFPKPVSKELSTMQYLGHMIFCRSRFTSAYKALSLWKQTCVGPELLRGRPRPPWTTEPSVDDGVLGYHGVWLRTRR